MSDFEPEAVAPPLPTELLELEANEDRGEIPITLGGMEMALRPSHDAIRRIEKGCGKNVVSLAVEAEANTMLSDHAAIAVTAMLRAWGGNSSASGANADKVGRLIHDVGLLSVLPRLALVLSLAASGGVTAEGFLKGEAVAPVTEEVAGAASQDSPAPPSDGPPTSSGKPRRTNSGPRSKSGKN